MTSPLATSALRAAGLCAALCAGLAHADPVFTEANVDFTGGSTSFGFLGSQYTFSDVSTGFFDFDPVAVTTTPNAAVTAFGAPFYDPPQPTTFFDPVRGDGTLVFDGSFRYDSFATATPIPFSATPSFIGLALRLDDGVHYGFARFAGTYLVSYGFEAIAGAGIDAAAVAAIPEPETYGLLLAGLAALGAWGRRRRQARD